ncbi:MAG: hypothetical protein RL060_856 [Bacteroidota bacterium]|jgi:gliding motility-associated-like protein
MTHLKINIGVLLLLALSLVGYAQESSNAAGGDASSADGTVNFSIGQDFYTYDDGGINGSISEGVQQTYDDSKAPATLVYNPAQMSINYANLGNSGNPSLDNGGEVVVFSFVGTTPEGISIDPFTGVITFANTLQVGVYPLMIKATNSKGSVKAPFELSVLGLKPSNLAYTPNVIVTDFRTEVASVNPTVNMGGLPVTYTLLGTVPTGISINANTGVITSSSKTVEGIYNLIVKASNEVGSETTSFIITVVGPAIIPQGFSPNGDGENDVFQLVGLENGPYKLSIFNRWGNIVFEKENYQNDWGGETNKSYALVEADGLLADATYYYIIESVNDKTKVGYVYINRSNQNK